MESRRFDRGYNVLTQQKGIHQEMGMDIGVQVLGAMEEVTFLDMENETAFLLLDGEITFVWQDRSETVSRHSVFDQKPAALHVPKGVKVVVIAATPSEVLVQKTTNSRDFAPVFYPPDAIEDVYLGDDNMQGCARRILRDIFNYANAPYSNMVLGEDIHLPGRWSSYPPHHHPQPEVYFYKFIKPQGFGVSIVGDTATVIMDNHISAIPGGLCHPQVTAPGYAMYYVWMIRHLEGNPWTDRIDDPAHTWLHDKAADLWEGPAYAK